MKFETYFEVCDTHSGIFDEIPKIKAKTAKEAVSKYLKTKNSNFKPEFARNGNGQIVVTKLSLFLEENKFYKSGRITTYNLINL
jgi:hypothetical protein